MELIFVLPRHSLGSIEADVQQVHWLDFVRTIKNPFISTAGVSFSKQFGLFVKFWTGKNVSYIWPKTYGLKKIITRNE